MKKEMPVKGSKGCRCFVGSLLFSRTSALLLENLIAVQAVIKDLFEDGSQPCSLFSATFFSLFFCSCSSHSLVTLSSTKLSFSSACVLCTEEEKEAVFFEFLELLLVTTVATTSNISIHTS
ncbi:unnamed protein product [Orchesella dallaii]|uniref:Uncharacterized protein n=1 Tax=Orchesella dallaii TaxID=48710 RepID=A0ABP1R9D3_9HEXA